MCVEHGSRPSRPDDGQVDCSFAGGLEFAANNPLICVDLQNLSGHEASFIESAGRNGQKQWMLTNDGAEIPAGTEHPAARIETPADLRDFTSDRLKANAWRFLRAIVSRHHALIRRN